MATTRRSRDRTFSPNTSGRARPWDLGAMVLLLALLPVAGGCVATTVTVPLEQELVWKVAMSEAVAWRPKEINIQDMTVHAAVSDPAAGLEAAYDLKVRPDWNPFARRPSTVIAVTMQQTKPVRRRFTDEEVMFINTVVARLQDYVGRQP